MDLEQRIKKLERSNKRLKILITLILLVGGAALLMGVTNKNAEFDEIIAKRIIVKEAGEETEIIIGDDSSDVFGGREKIIMIRNQKEYARISFMQMSISSEKAFSAIQGGFIVLYRSGVNNMININTLKDNSGSIDIYNKTGENIIELRGDE